MTHYEQEKIQDAMNELGVPQKGYPQNIANAYEILNALLNPKNDAENEESCKPVTKS